MTPELLRRVGEALYGSRWQSDLAHNLNVADRTVRRWVSGEYPIPDGVVLGLRALLILREIETKALIDEIG